MARHARVRKTVSGTSEVPRLNVFRSNKNIFAQIIDDEKGVTLVSASSIDKELNLKKAAKSVNEKSISMIKEKELLPLTGYIHGGCSPIGMKKFFKTTIDESAKNFETIIFSAGKVGYQVEVNLEDLKKVIPFNLSDLT